MTFAAIAPEAGSTDEEVHRIMCSEASAQGCLVHRDILGEPAVPGTSAGHAMVVQSCGQLTAYILRSWGVRICYYARMSSRSPLRHTWIVSRRCSMAM